MEWFVRQLRAMRDGGLDISVDDILDGMTSAIEQDRGAKFEEAVEKISDGARRRLATKAAA